MKTTNYLFNDTKYLCSKWSEAEGQPGTMAFLPLLFSLWRLFLWMALSSTTLLISADSPLLPSPARSLTANSCGSSMRRRIYDGGNGCSSNGIISSYNRSVTISWNIINIINIFPFIIIIIIIMCCIIITYIIISSRTPESSSMLGLARFFLPSTL